MLSRESALEKSNGCKTCAIECSVFASYCSQTHVNCGGIKDCDIRIKKSKIQSAYLRLFVERRGKFFTIGKLFQNHSQILLSAFYQSSPPVEPTEPTVRRDLQT